MKIELFPAKQLPRDLALRWAEIQQSNPQLCSPFFRPEFTAAVSAIRSDAFTASIDDGAAFFSFQRGRFRFARPIGGAVSDYHGVIGPQGYEFNPIELLLACGLRGYDFDHVPASQSPFASCAIAEGNSYILDIREESASGKGEHSRYAGKKRKLEREFGPVEIELDSQDPNVLQLCLEWKSAQYQRTGGNDLFARPWAQALVKAIASQRGAGFSSFVSVLRAGGRPVAAHFGMRSSGVLHYWFPSYDTAFSRYSPGMLLLLSMISKARNFGITTIDFGKGEADYKEQLCNRTVRMLEGSVAINSRLLALRRIPKDALNWARETPLLKMIPMEARIFLRRLERSRRYS